MTDVYQPQQVARRQVATTRVTGAGPEAFSTDVGRAMQRLGAGLGDAAQSLDRIAEIDAENEARTVSIAASAQVREELWGENGLMRKDGRAFIDNAEPTLKRLEEKARQYKGKNALSQRMIDDVVRREIEPARAMIDRSYVKAVDTERKTTATGRVQNLIDGAPAVFADDMAMRDLGLKLTAALDDEADAYAYDPETRQVKERQAWSQVFIYGIGNALATDDVDTAEKRFEQAVATGRMTAQATVEMRSRIAEAKNTLASEAFGMEVEQTGALTLGGEIDFKPPLAVPVEPSSTYGPRKHPVDGRVKQHTGIDYPVPEGTPVLASAPGVVAEVANRGGYGLMVRVDHGGGTESWYTHLSAADVKVGDSVKAGQRLAASGNSGKSTGPHLHYEVRHGGRPTDPAQARPVELTLENLRAVALERSGGDPKLFKRFMAEGSAAIARREAIKREREQAVLDEAWKYAETATKESDVPRAVWNALKPQQRESFRGHMKANLEGGTDTDISHYGVLMTMLSDRPKDFARYEFETDNKLSTSDKRSLIAQRTKLRAGSGDDPQRSSLEATNRAANLVMPSTFKDEQQNALKGVLFRAVATAEAAAGKPLTEKEIMDMAGRLAVDAATGQKTWTGKDKTAPLYEAGVGGVSVGGVALNRIPPEIRTRLIADYRKLYGKAPSNGELADQYVMLKSRGLIQ